MKKIIVIGCPGSGKSTFSRALHEITGLPVYHLDMLNWNADRTTVEKEVFRARLAEVIAKFSKKRKNVRIVGKLKKNGKKVLISAEHIEFKAK